MYKAGKILIDSVLLEKGAVVCFKDRHFNIPFLSTSKPCRVEKGRAMLYLGYIFDTQKHAFLYDGFVIIGGFCAYNDWKGILEILK